MRIDVRSLLSGWLFMAIGGWFAGNAIINLPVGTAQQMGPGMFPLALAAVLIVLGLLIIIQGFGVASVSLAAVPWRGIVLILLAPILFGALVEGLGLAPTVFVAAAVACFASRTMTLRRALAIALGLAVLCLLVFKLGLGVSVPAFGRWLGM